MNKLVSIAIDGPSGAGKSSLARRCAVAFGILYVDTGAIYRTVGLAAFRRGLDRKNEAAVTAMLPELEIRMAYNGEGEQRMFLTGRTSPPRSAGRRSPCAPRTCPPCRRSGPSCWRCSGRWPGSTA